MSRHLPLVFPPPNSATQSDMLPIMEVTVGPGRHKEIFARQRGYCPTPEGLYGASHHVEHPFSDDLKPRAALPPAHSASRPALPPSATALKSLRP